MVLPKFFKSAKSPDKKKPKSDNSPPSVLLDTTNSAEPNSAPHRRHTSHLPDEQQHAHPHPQPERSYTAHAFDEPNRPSHHRHDSSRTATTSPLRSSHPQSPLKSPSSKSRTHSHGHSHSLGHRQSRRDSQRQPSSPTTTGTTGTTANSKPSISQSKRKVRRAPTSSSSSRYSYDDHPLNLPPDELRRRFPTMAAGAKDDAAVRASMDLESEPPTSPAPSSVATQPQSSPVTSVSETNGVSGDISNDTNNKNSNGIKKMASDEERSPTPPPHIITPPPVDPEACKLAGNKFFKAGEYQRAIIEYTKGWS